MDRPTLRTIERGGGRTLAAEEVGDGPQVVLIHAGIADLRMWDDVVTALADSHRVIRYDLPGFGGSRLGSEPIDSTIDLEAVLDGCGVERAALVGASLGGRVALEFALERPGRVRALLLVAPGLRDHRWSPFLQGVSDEEEAAVERGDHDAAADLMVRTWVVGPARDDAEVDASVRERVHDMVARSYELYAEALAAGIEPRGAEPPEPPASARLGDIDVPALVLVGDADVPDMLQIADRLEAGIPAARKVLWEGVAHLPPMERPEAFARLALDFLQRVPP